MSLHSPCPVAPYCLARAHSEPEPETLQLAAQISRETGGLARATDDTVKRALQFLNQRAAAPDPANTCHILNGPKNSPLFSMPPCLSHMRTYSN